jgi:hypothetical protein
MDSYSKTSELLDISSFDTQGLCAEYTLQNTSLNILLTEDATKQGLTGPSTWDQSRSLVAATMSTATSLQWFCHYVEQTGWNWWHMSLNVSLKGRLLWRCG